MSRQRPLIDTPPNAVGLKYKSSSPSPRGHGARRAPQPISNPCSPPLVSLSHLSISPASPSRTIFGGVPAASQLSPPFHICLSPRLLLLSVSLPLIVFFPLHLDISLVSFRLLLPLALCISSLTVITCSFSASSSVSPLIRISSSVLSTCAAPGFQT